MSAKDDAPKPPAPIRFRLTTLALALAAGATLGVGIAVVGAPASQALFEVRLPWTGDAPSPGEWAEAPRAGESAVVETSGNGLVLAVRAPRAPRARELAAHLRHRREAGVAAMEVATRTLASQWASRLRPEPLPALTPAAECAAWLQASAAFSRDLARALPAPWSAAPLDERVAARAAAPVPVLERLQEVELAAQAHDPAALRDALMASERACDEWFASGVPARDAGPRTRGSAWRTWRLERADSLDARATALLASETPLQGSLAAAAADEHLLQLSNAFPEPYAALALAGALPAVPAPAPLPGPWGALLGWGAALGALVASAAAAAGLFLRRRVGNSTALMLPTRDPAGIGSGYDAWLHVVAGPNATAVARAALELSAHALARGERVLVVDGGSRLKLHERFGREARWGLMECLLADMPVLGLVQYGGRPGFYLLAHGNSTRGEGWASLGQRLDDIRPHFGRIVLALDTQAPRAIGDALAGRALEGWWAEAPGRYPSLAGEMSSRLGIAFSGMDLSVMPEVTLDLLSGRVRALAPVAPLAPLELVALPAPAPLPAAVMEPVAVPADNAPVVLDCDLQVLQRLRFLAWMRRVQIESRSVEAASAH